MRNHRSEHVVNAKLQLRRRLFILLTALVLSPASVHGHHDDQQSGPALQGAIFPNLSDDGKTIAFSYVGAIWRMSRGGGVMTRLTHEAGFDVEPAWSPDGKRIAFIRGRNSFAGQLQLIRSGNGEAVPLSSRILAKDKLFFDRTGQRILGNFRRPSGKYSICWLDVASGALGDVLRPDARGQRYALSNGGRSIALATTQDIRGEQGGNNGPFCDLWTMSASGGTPKKIGRFPGRVYEITWTADDRSLLVVTNVGGVHNDLWQVPLKNPLADARKLTFGQADEDRPCVTRDGRWMLYTDNRRGPTTLVLRDLKNSRNSLVSLSTMDFRQPAGSLSLRVVDKDGNSPVRARVSIQKINGKYHAPQGALYRMLRGDVHFYCSGKAKLNLPAGRYLVKVARGPEYPVVRRTFQVRANVVNKLSISIKRWIKQTSRNWYSGESHIHANYGYGQWYNSPRTMLAQCGGEDLNVCNFMVANSEADGVFDREFFRGRPDPLSTGNTVLYWNQEFRSTIWGHLTLLNLKQLVEPIFTGFKHTTHPHDHPTNADVADLTHDQHAHVNYTHPANNVKDPYLSAYSAKALPLDVALGKIDSIDVMGSSHVATMPLWYRLLNCGFRLPASAGTDCFLNRVRSRLPGQARVYVFVKGKFSYQRWIAALKAGRTFVTNGPMFEFVVNDRMAGGSLKMARPGKVSVRGRVVSQYPLNRVEIVYNGKVVASVKIDKPKLSVSIEQDISIPRSGWIAMRAAGPSQVDQPGGTVFGHTGAVYIKVENKPINAKKDAAYFITWIDRLQADIRRRNRIPSRHQQHVESQISAARDVFSRLLENSK